MSTAVAPAAPERMEFRTELKQVLDLIIHSLYTKKEIFLRELISNAADAIDKVRFEGLTNGAVLEGNTDWKIELIADEKARTLTIRDNGIGLSREGVVDNLGTIAKSGTKAFLENLKKADVKDRPELIGQFGVGFYSAFMVADRVSVISRTAGSPGDGVKWESDGQGEFTVEAVEKAARGTDVIIHLREGEDDFLKGWRLREIVKQYSDFIEHPIVTETEKDGKKEPETLNSRKAIWLRAKSEVKAEEYNAFYKQISRDFEDPIKTIHFAAEGTMEFKALLYIPKQKPMDFFWGPPKSGLQLYVRRVLIQHDNEELLPTYLRFVKGVVDSSDLPLNVSREMLQHNPVLTRIRSNLVNRVIKTLDEMKSSEAQAYGEFFKQFGQVLKEGIGQDYANQERLADLLLFESTQTAAGKTTTLGEYVSRMGERKEIYYLIGESRAMLENSPYLEAFKARGEEVLLMTDPVDEFLVSSLNEFKGKTLKAVDKGDVNKDEIDEQKKKAFAPLIDALKQKIGEVKEVRLSSRLKESAAVLVADEGAMSAHMERLMRRMGRGDEMGESKRVLELNPEHAVVAALQKLAETSADDARIEEYGRLLYDQAVLAEGSKLADPAAFSRRVNALMAKGLAG